MEMYEARGAPFKSPSIRKYETFAFCPQSMSTALTVRIVVDGGLFSAMKAYMIPAQTEVCDHSHQISLDSKSLYLKEVAFPHLQQL